MSITGMRTLHKCFEFGKIAYYTKTKCCAVTVDVEYREQENGSWEFAASAQIGKRCAGQCLDEIARSGIRFNQTFREIYDLWKKYHLNGMHPECEHQRELGWNKEAREQVTIAHIWLKREVSDKKRALENRVMQSCIDNGQIQITPEEQRILGLPSYYDIREDLFTDNVAQDYEIRNRSTKRRGEIFYENDPQKGILCKPCPVCGYKYGTSWKELPIPEIDQKRILALFDKELADIA